jgi:transmembrane protein TMEM43
MAKSKNRPLVAVLILVVIAAAFGAYVWFQKRHAAGDVAVAPPSSEHAAPGVATAVSADRVDPANEGRLVTLSGPLEVRRKATDTQLGIGADAILLMRFAQMLQWREACDGANCSYKEVWSPQPIDSGKFPADHRNPARLPITTERFAAGEIRLGAFRVDAAALGTYRLGGSQRTKPLPYPVKSADLPSNLAMTFRDVGGELYAGDPLHRQVGDVRVSYRIIPAGKVEITGMQRGDRIVVQKVSDNAP